jgi:hypothetical protein
MSIVYLSHARVRDNTTIPVDDLISHFQELARQFPMPAKPGRDGLREHARGILNAMPDNRNDMYWHGQNKQACPCSSCCASAYRLLQPHIEEYFRFKQAKHRRSAA